MAESSSPEGAREWPWSTIGGKKVPSSYVPERRSSKVRLKEGTGAKSSLHEPDSSSPRPPRPFDTTKTIRSRGRSSSPLRQQDIHARKPPSRTFVPTVFPIEILYQPKLTHTRFLLDLRLSSPVFVGGATVEGEVHLVLDGGLARIQRKGQANVAISRIFVTLMGIESCKGKQEIFRALTVDVVDDKTPLPQNMAPKPVGDGSWTVQPSSTILPFRLDLPVMMGPPPYTSKRAGIKYMVSTTVEAFVNKRKVVVRQSKDIVVLTVHDPEKALVNLASPLTVADEMYISQRHGVQKIVLSAGVHRQTWIGGYPIFVDVHVDNRSARHVRKIELQLEKTTTFHSHSAPHSDQGLAAMLRLPNLIQKEIIAKRDVSDGLRGILPISQDLATYQMDLPAGSLSIETGRFFGVRFFLNVKISCSFHRHIQVQLPITIIHPNSIDIPTNALAQVTASIEHKHRNLTSASGTGSPYRYRPGQAFTAARRQSYLELRTDTFRSGDLDSLTRALERSPRRSERNSNSSPKRMKIVRRQSAIAVGTKTKPSGKHQQHRTLSKQQASFDNGVRYRTPYITNDTTLVGEPRVSFEDRWGQQQQQLPPSPPPHSRAELPGVQQTKSNAALHRSSLEAKVHRGLRGLSIEMINRGPRLQKSTSGLAFDSSDESDKENQPPPASTALMPGAG